MVALTQVDVLRALKRCLCLAQQDVLFSDYLANGAYWKKYAVARYGVYKWLQSMVLEHGVNPTYLLATARYDDLPLFVTSIEKSGEKEALEVFFLFVAGKCASTAQIHA